MRLGLSQILLRKRSSGLDSDVRSYMIRVESDSGTVVDPIFLKKYVKFLKKENLWNTLRLAWGSSLGVKINNDKATKVYSLKGNADLTPLINRDAWSLANESLNGEPVFFFDSDQPLTESANEYGTDDLDELFVQGQSSVWFIFLSIDPVMSESDPRQHFIIQNGRVGSSTSIRIIKLDDQFGTTHMNKYSFFRDPEADLSLTATPTNNKYLDSEFSIKSFHMDLPSKEAGFYIDGQLDRIATIGVTETEWLIDGDEQDVFFINPHQNTDQLSGMSFMALFNRKPTVQEIQSHTNFLSEFYNL